MFKKLFGKKNDGFYMQIDDAPTPKVAAKAAPTPTPVSAPVAAAPATPAAQTEQKVAAVEKAAAKAAKTEKKSQTAPAKDLAPAPAPALPPITNFATDYLIKPSSDSNRRRPGANMSKFLELAREAKIPVNIKK